MEGEKVADDDFAVLIAHGGLGGFKIRDGKRTAAAKLAGGFVVGSKTKVVKSYY